MQRVIAIISFVALLLAGCAVKELENPQMIAGEFPTFYASFDIASDGMTKTYVDNKMALRWSAEDCLSIFSSTYNRKYQFMGETGDSKGTFSSVDGSFSAGGEIPTNYAVYPFSSNTYVTEDGQINLMMPAAQTYANRSFGKESNVMVAVTLDHFSRDLVFNNICGFLVVRLYGEGKIKSITLRGNNGEKISGSARVSPKFGEKPEVQMLEYATTSIGLNCGDGVQLGDNSETATEFWFCVPPVTFSNGFTIAATSTEGRSMELSVSSSKTITRNVANFMSPAEAAFDIPVGNIEFEDALFKEYCLEEFDNDNDGEISFAEAAVVESMYPHITATQYEENKYNAISSLKGIEWFRNLKYLDCTYSYVTEMDFSGNPEIETIICYYNDLESINVSNNPKLKKLYAAQNKLTFVDLTNNTELEWLSVFNNPISSIDLSKNPKIWFLFLSGPLEEVTFSSNTAKVTTLNLSGTLLHDFDLSDFPNLEDLELASNRNIANYDFTNNQKLKRLMIWDDVQCMGGLDISMLTDLEELDLGDNKIDELDISNNVKLKHISIWNQGKTINNFTVSHLHNLETLELNYCGLSSIDLSSNLKLKRLSCIGNGFQVLDVSSNVSLQELDCTENPLLTSIFVWDGFVATEWFKKDDSALFVVVP